MADGDDLTGTNPHGDPVGVLPERTTSDNPTVSGGRVYLNGQDVGTLAGLSLEAPDLLTGRLLANDVVHASGDVYRYIANSGTTALTGDTTIGSIRVQTSNAIPSDTIILASTTATGTNTIIWQQAFDASYVEHQYNLTRTSQRLWINDMYRRAADHYAAYEIPDAMRCTQVGLEALGAEREETRKAVRVQANDRALQLFLSMLTPEQRQEHEKERIITVESATSRRRYRIKTAVHDGRHGNIIELAPDGKPVASLCCAPGGDIPHFDAILGQAVALQFDEERFRQKANFTALVRDYVRAA